MIHYLVTVDHSYTIDWFLYTWEPSLLKRVRVLFYERLPDEEKLDSGTYIFSDLERLVPVQLDALGQLADRLIEHGCRVLNHPRLYLSRYQLLQTLHARGESQFQIYRVAETREPGRFPVFLRPDHGHEIVSDLLYSRSQLDSAISRTARDGYSAQELLMVEYLDTTDETGYFRKYACLLIGDRIVPAWLDRGKEWALRWGAEARPYDPVGADERWAYIEREPREDWVRYVFQMSGVQFGRVDYSLLHGKPQLWEINTNPTVVHHRAQGAPEYLEIRSLVARRYCEAFEELEMDV